MVKQSDLPKNCYPGENFLQFHLRPNKKQGFDRSDIPSKLDTNSILLETQTLLDGRTHATCASGLEEKTCDRLERKTLGSVRSLSTSSSARSRDMIRETRPLQIVGNPIREMLEAVGVTFIGEDEGHTLTDIIKMKAEESQFKRNNYEIVFLGTGAALPSKYRNVSSTLINMR